MKNYCKPELERITFVAEEIATASDKYITDTIDPIAPPTDE